MARQDLLEFLKRGLDALDFKGDVSLDWDKKSHSFVVDLVFYIENKAGQQMEDADGVLSDEPIIAFSDAILIYDGKKALQDTMRMIFWHVLRLTARKVGVLRTERLF